MNQRRCCAYCRIRLRLWQRLRPIRGTAPFLQPLRRIASLAGKPDRSASIAALLNARLSSAAVADGEQGRSKPRTQWSYWPSARHTCGGASSGAGTEGARCSRRARRPWAFAGGVGLSRRASNGRVGPASRCGSHARRSPNRWMVYTSILRSVEYSAKAIHAAIDAPDLMLRSGHRSG